MSINWLLSTYLSAKTSAPAIAHDMLIVPVMISYDRIFEHLNLATEMISGEKHDFTLVSSLYRIFTTQADKMGHVYVKYLTPIGIQEYL